MRDGEVLHEATLGLAADGSPRHSTALLGEVERAAAASGGWDRVGLIAVGRGPGSFVGIRIGLATARGLAASTNVPVGGICTLDALGHAMAERGEGDNLAVLDARRGEAFAALYSSAGERLWEPLVIGPEALAGRLSDLTGPLLAAGSGAVRFRQELADRDVDIPDDADPLHRVSARHICALAGTGGGDSLDPIYLRPPDAQRWRERDTSQRAE
jgi:tRNA threonylcarbamoyladenosine biosynthesis protein TsaB